MFSIIGPGHQHSLVDAVAFPSYPRHALLKRDLTIWLTKIRRFDKLFIETRAAYGLALSSEKKGQGMVAKQFSECCPLMMTKGVRLSKKLPPHTITPD
ncbi:hypothetical protein TNCV_1578391 [Trichonephila clavipes]|nr:hypothetical protein TNCV_1578391 [Trichonephila clavipes]